MNNSSHRSKFQSGDLRIKCAFLEMSFFSLSPLKEFPNPLPILMRCCIAVSEKKKRERERHSDLDVKAVPFRQFCLG